MKRNYFLFTIGLFGVSSQLLASELINDFQVTNKAVQVISALSDDEKDGILNVLKTNNSKRFASLKETYDLNKKPIFGFLAYVFRNRETSDLENDLKLYPPYLDYMIQLMHLNISTVKEELNELEGKLKTMQSLEAERYGRYAHLYRTNPPLPKGVNYAVTIAEYPGSYGPGYKNSAQIEKNISPLRESKNEFEKKLSKFEGNRKNATQYSHPDDQKREYNFLAHIQKSFNWSSHFGEDGEIIEKLFLNAFSQ